MSVVKHTPSTDALDTLGSVITPAEKRDAIHLAVEPVRAAETLRPGDHVGFLADGSVGLKDKNTIGIVDPFLTRPVKKDEWFWRVVYPREITSLRHVWSHPAFTDEVERPHVPYPMPDLAAQDPVPRPFTVPRPEKVRSLEEDETEKSRQWIERFANGLSLGYEDLMQGASDYLDCGDYLNRGSLLEGEYVPDEFWDHYQVVKKEKVDENDRGSFFTCSC